jgi:hypothetical protein
MKKALIPIAMVLSLIIYLLSDDPAYGKYLKIIAIVILMIAMMQLMARIPSKNDKEDSNDDYTSNQL